MGGFDDFEWVKMRITSKSKPRLLAFLKRDLLFTYVFPKVLITAKCHTLRENIGL